MKVLQKIRNGLEELEDMVTHPLLVGLAALSIGGYGLSLGIQTAFDGLDQILGATVVEYQATLDNKTKVPCLPDGGSYLWCGVFTTKDGKTVEVLDIASPLYGRFLSNDIIPSLERGRPYTVKVVDSPLGIDRIIDAKPAH